MNIEKLSVVGVIFLMIGCNSNSKNEESVLKLNNIQVIGSHNSYKQAIEPALLQLIQHTTSKPFEELQYSHTSITEQLETYKLRNLEIDVVYDPNGGRFSKPLGLELLKQQGIPIQPYDSLGAMNKPGFKTMHAPDIDFRTSCATLINCLEEIKVWSNAHPNHLPICITFNAKAESIEMEGFQKLLLFTPEAFEAFEAEILSVIPKEKIITPDVVRGKFETLEASVLENNWPKIEAARGKLILVLDEGGQKRADYIKGHPSLKGRLLFTKSDPGNPEAAFIIMNNPIADHDSIQKLVKLGYLVRTRADDDTKEARANDYTRFKAALSSGAHFISTDYYKEDPSLKTGYKIEMPNNKVARCNPVFSSEGCLDKYLE